MNSEVNNLATSWFQIFATITIMVFCVLGSIVWFEQLASKRTVEHLNQAVQQNQQQTSKVATQVKQVEATATDATQIAKQVKSKDLHNCNSRIDSMIKADQVYDRRLKDLYQTVGQLQKEIQDLKKESR